MNLKSEVGTDRFFQQQVMNSQPLIVELNRASAESDVRTLRDILSKNPYLINHPQCSDVRRMLLFKATFENNQEIFELIVNFPKRIMFHEEDNIDKHLSSAIYKGNVRLVEFLLKSGASLQGPDWQGDLPAQRIFDRMNIDTREDILKLLIEYGMDTSIRDEKGRNLLQQFISEFVKKNDQDAAKIAEILLKHGLTIDEVDQDGYSPLVLSLCTQNEDLIQILIKRGANVNKKCTVRGTLPLFVAIRVNNLELVELLLSSGAKLDATDNEKWTALHVACFHHREQMIGFLIRKGADVCAKDEKGRNPFYFLDPEVPNYGQCMSLMVKEFSKLMFEKISVSDKDEDFILDEPMARKYFENCTSELEKMASTVINGSHSYYTILGMSKNVKKLAMLLKDEDFVQEFISKLGMFSCYESDLTQLLEEAFQITDRLDHVDSRINSSFGDFLLFPTS